MTQAQSAAQKKRGYARPGTDAAESPQEGSGTEPARLESSAEPAQKGNGPAGSRSRGKASPSGPCAAPEAQRKKKAAGFPAAHMEKDAVTPT